MSYVSSKPSPNPGPFARESVDVTTGSESVTKRTISPSRVGGVTRQFSIGLRSVVSLADTSSRTISLPDVAPVEPGPSYKAYLHKTPTTKNTPGNWQKRWFVLDGYLLTYSPIKDGKIAGLIDLHTVEDITEMDDGDDDDDPTESSKSKKKERAIFKVITPLRTYFMDAHTPENRTDWITRLKRTIGYFAADAPYGAVKLIDRLRHFEKVAATADPNQFMGMSHVSIDENKPIRLQPIDIQGPLYKTSGGRRHGGGIAPGGWQKRWFILKYDLLTYSQTKDDYPSGLINLHDVEEVREFSSDTTKDRYVFSVVTPRRTFFFYACSKAERSDWIFSLNMNRLYYCDHGDDDAGSRSSVESGTESHKVEGTGSNGVGGNGGNGGSGGGGGGGEGEGNGTAPAPSDPPSLNRGDGGGIAQPPPRRLRSNSSEAHRPRKALPDGMDVSKRFTVAVSPSRPRELGLGMQDRSGTPERARTVTTMPRGTAAEPNRSVPFLRSQTMPNAAPPAGTHSGEGRGGDDLMGTLPRNDAADGTSYFGSAQTAEGTLSNASSLVRHHYGAHMPARTAMEDDEMQSLVTSLSAECDSDDEDGTDLTISTEELKQSATLKEGYLHKALSPTSSKWSKRWFSINDEYLTYAASPDAYPSGLIPVTSVIEVGPLDLPKRRYTFTIATRKKTFFLSAADDADVNEWVRVMRVKMSAVLNRSSDLGMSVPEPSPLGRSPLTVAGHHGTPRIPAQGWKAEIPPFDKAGENKNTPFPGVPLISVRENRGNVSGTAKTASTGEAPTEGKGGGGGTESEGDKGTGAGVIYSPVAGFTSDDYLNLSADGFEEVCTSDFQCSVSDFFRLFLADYTDGSVDGGECGSGGANKTLSAFSHDYHVKRGDCEIEVGLWGNPDENGVCKSIKYRAPVNAPFGPKSCIVTEFFRYNIQPDKIMVEFFNSQTDVPYNDYFQLENKMNVTSTGKDSCHLSINTGVHFFKRTILKGKIASEAIKNSTNSYKIYVEMMQDVVLQEAAAAGGGGGGGVDDSEFEPFISPNPEGFENPDFLAVPEAEMEPLHAPIDLPISVLSFFGMFIGGGQKYEAFVREFRAKRNETELEIGPWEDDPHSGKKRVISFRSPVRVPMGPKSCVITERARYHLTKTLLQVETFSTQTDVPYNDYFQLENRWKVSSTGDSSCRLTMKMGVHFVKKTFLKGKITSASLDQTKKSAVLLAEMLLEKATTVARAAAGAAGGGGPLNPALMKRPVRHAALAAKALAEENSPSSATLMMLVVVPLSLLAMAFLYLLMWWSGSSAVLDGLVD